MGRKNMINRRRFLKQSAGALGGIAVSSALPGLAEARTGRLVIPRPVRRHMFTIMPNGSSGWDGMSFQSGLDPSRMTSANVVTVDKVGSADVAAGGNKRWTPRESVASGLAPVPHPNAPGHLLGPGMSIFNGTGILANDLLICKGMTWADGGHDVGSYVMSGGMRSRYATCYSSLIAQFLGAFNPRTLHYVHIAPPAGEMGALQANTNLLGGLAAPINIPVSALPTAAAPGAWDSMTAPLATDLDATRRDVLARTVAGLTGAAGSVLQLNTSRQLFGDFLSGFNASAQLSSSGWAKSPGFQALVAHYTAAVASDVTSHPFSTRKVGVNFATPISMDTSVLAYRFALVDFLFSQNISAVVDMPGPFSDAHGGQAGDALRLLACYAGVKALILRLKTVQYDPITGTTLWDPIVSPTRGESITDGLQRRLDGAPSVWSATTFAMFTEFDRDAEFSYIGAVTNKWDPGTDHGASASLILGGMGVRTGAVVGDVRHADDSFGKDGRIGAAMPVNLETGQVVDGEPGKGGVDYLYSENVFPTMMAIFGVPVPAQQTTNRKYAPSLVTPLVAAVAHEAEEASKKKRS